MTARKKQSDQELLFDIELLTIQQVPKLAKDQANQRIQKFDINGKKRLSNYEI